MESLPFGWSWFAGVMIVWSCIVGIFPHLQPHRSISFLWSTLKVLFSPEYRLETAKQDWDEKFGPELEKRRAFLDLITTTIEMGKNPGRSSSESKVWDKQMLGVEYQKLVVKYSGRPGTVEDGLEYFPVTNGIVTSARCIWSWIKSARVTALELFKLWKWFKKTAILPVQEAARVVEEPEQAVSTAMSKTQKKRMRRAAGRSSDSI